MEKLQKKSINFQEISIEDVVKKINEIIEYLNSDVPDSKASAWRSKHSGGGGG
jgi:hypothetical protein